MRLRRVPPSRCCDHPGYPLTTACGQEERGVWGTRLVKTASQPASMSSGLLLGLLWNGVVVERVVADDSKERWATRVLLVETRDK